mgnify:CR=1 FL=1
MALKNMSNQRNLSRVNKHCQPEIALWGEVKGNSIEGTLRDYFDLTVHLLCVLSEERAKLERLNKK